MLIARPDNGEANDKQDRAVEVNDRSDVCCPDVKIQRFGNAERDQREIDQCCDLF